ncbi:MAG: hypothetical protein HQ568_01925, partial [Calditrichaeota bacterium]|nr:hypothetical protein [Calditrichota bacterium]
MKLLQITLLIILLTTINMQAEILNVPDDFETIQGAIDDAEAGDTVLVQPGTYEENLTIPDREMTIASLILTTGDQAYTDSTVIEGAEDGQSVITFDDVGEDVVLTGFTITGGGGRFGAGINCIGSSPTLTFLNLTENNSTWRGGGIYCGDDSNPVIDMLWITNNFARFGGGIGIERSQPVISRMLVADNTSDAEGGGLYLNQGSLDIVNSTFVNNQCDIASNLYFLGQTLTLTNCIFWNNPGPDVLALMGQTNIDHCDIQDGRDGVDARGRLNYGNNNISEDPEFINADEGDYHLTEDSPCIDTGDPDSPEDPDETRADMGAYFFDQRHVPGILY